MRKCNKSNWMILYVKYVKYVYWDTLIFPKYELSCPNELTFKRNIFYLLNYWLFFPTVYMSHDMVINSKNINQSIQTLFGE